MYRGTRNKRSGSHTPCSITVHTGNKRTRVLSHLRLCPTLKSEPQSVEKPKHHDLRFSPLLPGCNVSRVTLYDMGLSLQTRSIIDCGIHVRQKHHFLVSFVSMLRPESNRSASQVETAEFRSSLQHGFEDIVHEQATRFSTEARCLEQSDACNAVRTKRDLKARRTAKVTEDKSCKPTRRKRNVCLPRLHVRTKSIQQDETRPKKTTSPQIKQKRHKKDRGSVKQKDKGPKSQKPRANANQTKGQRPNGLRGKGPRVKGPKCQKGQGLRAKGQGQGALGQEPKGQKAKGPKG